MVRSMANQEHPTRCISLKESVAAGKDIVVKVTLGPDELDQTVSNLVTATAYNHATTLIVPAIPNVNGRSELFEG
jgi:hypothetical protein